jgi:hypothetical protein
VSTDSVRKAAASLNRREAVSAYLLPAAPAPKPRPRMPAKPAGAAP